jgi:hypothetical protein
MEKIAENDMTTEEDQKPRKKLDSIDNKTKKKKTLKKEDKKSEKKDERTAKGISISYSVQEEQFMAENFYQSNVDYDNLFSYSFSVSSQSEEYEQGKSISTAYSDTASETLNTKEADDTIQKVQYAAMLGAGTEVSSIARKKLATWAMYNKAELMLFHNLNGLTNDVDYNKIM